jgi:peptide/nickel transport system substrate-binding protein
MEFQAQTARIDREIDPAKRLPLVHQAEAIMEQDPPLLPVAQERMNEIWCNYVKGLNPAAYFGIFDVVRLDTVWIDKA